jgi:hypothetical protein
MGIIAPHAGLRMACPCAAARRNGHFLQASAGGPSHGTGTPRCAPGPAAAPIHSRALRAPRLHPHVAHLAFAAVAAAPCAVRPTDPFVRQRAVTAAARPDTRLQPPPLARPAAPLPLREAPGPARSPPPPRPAPPRPLTLFNPCPGHPWQQHHHHRGSGANLLSGPSRACPSQAAPPARLPHQPGCPSSQAAPPARLPLQPGCPTSQAAPPAAWDFQGRRPPEGSRQSCRLHRPPTRAHAAAPSLPRCRNGPCAGGGVARAP